MELKPGYKQTEVGVIPEDWDCVRIGDVAETSSGATPPRAKQQEYFDGGTIPWVKTLDLNNSSILKTDECVTPSALQQTSLRLYPSGSVLVAMYGGFNQIGRTGMLTRNATINQALTAIRPDQSRLTSRFLLNYLNFRVEYWKSVASSSRKDPNITGRDVREFSIPLPSLKEQDAASEALQDIEDQILMLNGLIDKKTDIKQAAMQELLTGKRRLPGFEGEWEVKRLGDVLKFQVGCPFSSAFFNDKEQGLRLVKNRDLKSDDQVFHYSGKYDQSFQVIDGDVLVGMDGDFFPCRWGKGPALLNQRVGRIVPMRGLNRSFAFYYLLGPLKEIESTTSGTTVKHLSHGDIEDIEKPLPSVPEQNSIAAVLIEMDAELAVLEQRLEKTCALKQGMMQQLLTGKFRLR